jgi:hypothetical protein
MQPHFGGAHDGVRGGCYGYIVIYYVILYILCYGVAHDGVRGGCYGYVILDTVRTIYHAAKILFLGGAASSHPLKYINS